MKRLIVTTLLLTVSGFLFAQTFSGVSETKLNFAWSNAPAAPSFSYGAEEYANLRVKFSIGEYGDFFGAFNAIAAAGNHLSSAYSPGALSGSFAYGENYAAVFEVERLYLQIAGDVLQWQGGLVRIPFGYGLAWGPMDFINPRNPLETDARPRAALATTFAFYPASMPFADDGKLFAFAAAPEDPLLFRGGGARAGISFDSHWERASLQLLYAYETPSTFPAGRHRAGISAKLDAVLGWAAEMLYTADPSAISTSNWHEGIAASFGADYSFLDGKLYLLAEYVFSGDAGGNKGLRSIALRHNWYAALQWKWSEITRISAGGAASTNNFGAKDYAATPFARWEHDVFQGVTINLQFLAPFNADYFSISAVAGVKAKF